MKKATLIFAGLLILTGCTSTYVTSSWKAQNASIIKYNKILVIGIMSDSNRDLRQNMEKDLVQDLKANGVNAVSAFDASARWLSSA